MVVLLLLAACALVPLKMVLVKMLPFDNKSEFQVMINMPDGTPLEQTTRVAQALGGYLSQQNDVTNYQIYAGTSGPYNFNGLVRHYYLRSQPNQADIQVNLLPRYAQRAESCNRETDAARAGPDRSAVWSADSSLRSTPGASGAADTGGRNIRTGSYKGSWRLLAK